MKVIIVGAGIAGLSLAISLGQAEHQVLLLESAHALAEIGAGVQMTPNAIKCFFDLGLKDDLMAASAMPGHMNIRHGKKGHVLGSVNIRDFESDYRAPYILIHRPILHNILHKHALNAGAEVRVNSKVTEYLFAEASVIVNNTERLQANLVVAADGINSSARTALLGSSDLGTMTTGWAGYRMMCEVSRIKQNPALAEICTNTDLDTNLWIGPSQSAMTYLIKDAMMLNIVLSHRDNIDTSSWKPHQYQGEIYGMFRDWDPHLRELLSISLPKITNYPVHHIPPLPTWNHESGRFCLLGDAAHAMAFYLSMGVSLAVEDAVALTECLNITDSPNRSVDDHLKLAVKLFETTRKIRCERVQAESTRAGDILHLDDGPEQEIRDEGLRREAEQGFFLGSDEDDYDHSVNNAANNATHFFNTEIRGEKSWLYGIADKTTRDWCYGYDVKRAVHIDWSFMLQQIEMAVQEQRTEEQREESRRLMGEALRSGDSEDV